MKKHPILFCGGMVRAVQVGRKTQTRRLRGLDRVNRHPDHWRYLGLASPREGVHVFHDPGGEGLTVEVKCPYGVPGDRLWVRETWSPWADKATEAAVAQKGEKCVYRADYQEGAGAGILGGDGRWHPSIHMPRWAARIWLEVTSVRVERVQEIQGYDVTREGIGNGGCADDFAEDYAAFARLWDSINDKRGFGWDVNPWVWVVGFKMLGAGK